EAIDQEQRLSHQTKPVGWPTLSPSRLSFSRRQFSKLSPFCRQDRLLSESRSLQHPGCCANAGTRHGGTARAVRVTARNIARASAVFIGVSGSARAGGASALTTSPALIRQVAPRPEFRRGAATQSDA